MDARVGAALDRGLEVVVNVHHYHELCEAPDEHVPRFLALWRQIATVLAEALAVPDDGSLIATIH
ncbi:MULTISPECIES: hypothetical protein [unclassified Amycolatopsis]|uniref:hypothetical protein n=1 Tax=unclassified Amycolatopsis TaxID=2618356 RepID=UPI0037BF0D12